jgi:polyphosphate kinase 2 (PPK2 family)
MTMAKPAVTRGRMSKKVYEAQLPELREQLVQLQVQLKTAPFKLVLIVAGAAGAGRGDVLNALGEWLDPRGVETFSFHTPTDEERDRPLMWRYWRSLPANGRIGVFAGSWYTETLREQATDKKELAQLDHELRRIRHFEKLLTDNSALVLKVWLHLSKENQRDRLRALESDPDKAWRVTDDDWDAHRQYDELAETARHIVRETDRPNAPWTVIDAADERARNLAVGQLIVRRLQSHFKRIQRRLATARLQTPDSCRGRWRLRVCVACATPRSIRSSPRTITSGSGKSGSVACTAASAAPRPRAGLSSLSSKAGMPPARAVRSGA